ncbi:hypothetical protein FCN77_20535 [Arthrobacter sp. 24S4-2]|uniref:hypothetical protein n=1 Tax=Arthrobacter sp. 24S4-2 TaxID=2575374 RepID=UPI0010C775B0|nr:hypothetical protein [Arthrobacter sp. 24S4-2]QCO99654.1 hypothetical protein FCN77_20535 [Arthrobacter sp. 24S4-2]
MHDPCISDWCTLDGAEVAIRQQGNVVCAGIVDGVTTDGRILWVLSPIDGRRLFEKSEFYEASPIEERAKGLQPDPAIRKHHIRQP